MAIAELGKIRKGDWTSLATHIDRLATPLGMQYSERKRMVNAFLCIAMDKMVMDSMAFGDWVEEKYPEYKEKSLHDFLMDKDPEHLEEWKLLLGVESSKE